MPSIDATSAAMFIDGQSVWGDATITISDPASPREVVGEASKGNREHADQAVSAAVAAQRGWASLGLSERGRLLKEAAARTLDGLASRTELLVRENGKIRAEAEADCGSMAGFAELVVAIAESAFNEEVIEDADSRIVISRKPIGVVLAIIPFNWPVALLASKLAPALVAGNTVVVKPPPQCPLALIDTVQLLGSALPPGVVNVVIGDDDEVSKALVQDPRIGRIAFTGGTDTGVAISTGVTNVKRLLLELGGNDAAIVLDDAVLDDDAINRFAVGAVSTSGQLCFAIKRAYVHESLFDDFCERLSGAFDRQVVGPGLAEGVTIGPLISEAARSRAETLIRDAEQLGAKILELGSLHSDADPGGYFLRPHLAIQPPQSSLLVQDEQFAPVLPVLSFSSEDEAIALANDSRFGLSGSVWSADEERAFRVAEEMEAGVTFINDHTFASADPRAPFGGFKQSGVGRELGVVGLQGYTELHATIRKRVGSS